jgi:hypothetical protein
LRRRAENEGGEATLVFPIERGFALLFVINRFALEQTGRIFLFESLAQQYSHTVGESVLFFTSIAKGELENSNAPAKLTHFSSSNLNEPELFLKALREVN